jgi:hypothetical protein
MVPEVVNVPPVIGPVVATEVTVPVPLPPDTSAAQFVALFGSTNRTAACPEVRIRVDEPLIVQVVGVTVIELLPDVELTSLAVQFGTARVIAVGKVTATLTEPTYSTRFGEQSALTMVSVEVVPVTALPMTPGSEFCGGVATPPDGIETRV